LRVLLIVATLVAVMLGIGIVGLGVRCFRVVTEDNPALGLISYDFRFCSVHRITCDVNRDGVVDAEAAIASGVRVVPTTEFTILEGREALDLDGIFNLRYHYEGPDRVLVLELDFDKDGKFEERLSGAAAEERFRNLRGSEIDAILRGSVTQACAWGHSRSFRGEEQGTLLPRSLIEP